MPRIESYIVKTVPLTPEDKWIGTDSSGNVTKNFTPQSIAEFINESDIVSVAGQNMFMWQNSAGPRPLGSISLESFGGDGTNLADLSSVLISTSNYGENVIIDYLLTLVDKYIILVESEDSNSFVVAEVVTLTQNVTNPLFYDLTLNVIEANGTVTGDTLYALAVYPGFQAQVPGTGDLDYTHSQAAATTTWVINHNLGKFASIQTFNPANVRIYGRETHISVNEITVDFGEALAGKAYCN